MTLKKDERGYIIARLLGFETACYTSSTSEENMLENIIRKLDY